HSIRHSPSSNDRALACSFPTVTARLTISCMSVARRALQRQQRACPFLSFGLFASSLARTRLRSSFAVIGTPYDRAVDFEKHPPCPGDGERNPLFRRVIAVVLFKQFVDHVSQQFLRDPLVVGHDALEQGSRVSDAQEFVQGAFDLRPEAFPPDDVVFNLKILQIPVDEVLEGIVLIPEQWVVVHRKARRRHPASAGEEAETSPFCSIISGKALPRGATVRTLPTWRYGVAGGNQRPRKISTVGLTSVNSRQSSGWRAAVNRPHVSDAPSTAQRQGQAPGLSRG